MNVPAQFRRPDGRGWHGCGVRQTALRGIGSRSTSQRCIPVGLGAVQAGWRQGGSRDPLGKSVREGSCEDRPAHAGSDSLPSRSSAPSRPVASASPSGANLIRMRAPAYSQLSVRVRTDEPVGERGSPYVAFPIHLPVAALLQSGRLLATTFRRCCDAAADDRPRRPVSSRSGDTP